LTKNKSSIVYIGRNNNVHDQRFVEVLSEIFEVREIYTQNSQLRSSQTEVFSNVILVIAGPLTDAVSAIPLEVKVPIFGISHAFDLNIEYGDFPILANIKRCKAIMSDCRHITNILREIYDFKGKIYEIPWGCDYDFFSKVDIQFENKPSILVTRNWFTPYRNEVIVSALESLELKEFEFECTFIGDGHLLEKQIQDLWQHSIKKKLRFLGHQNRLEIRNAMASNWLYISAASSDGTSISLLEAMAAGMICVTTDFPSNREWIEHSINGFTFPNGDSKALASLIELISSLSLEEKLEISRAAKDMVLKRGNWRNNQKTFISSVMSNVQ
jgi:glycosyltransferase involved in cell wall biosynthesis